MNKHISLFRFLANRQKIFSLITEHVIKKHTLSLYLLFIRENPFLLIIHRKERRKKKSFWLTHGSIQSFQRFFLLFFFIFHTLKIERECVCKIPSFLFFFHKHTSSSRPFFSRAHRREKKNEKFFTMKLLNENVERTDSQPIKQA